MAFVVYLKFTLRPEVLPKKEISVRIRRDEMERERR